MKTRESGMPDEAAWRGFFDPDRVLATFGVDQTMRDAADFGCGYGLFALAAARRISGVVHAFDIEPEMVARCREAAVIEGIANLRIVHRDFMDEGTDLPDGSVDFAMLFNILHAEMPVRLLREARRILRLGGRVGVIHWNYDPATPRGPSMDIRPRPDDCERWLRQARFAVDRGVMDLPPYHYGLVGIKKE